MPKIKIPFLLIIACAYGLFFLQPYSYAFFYFYLFIFSVFILLRIAKFGIRNKKTIFIITYLIILTFSVVTIQDSYSKSARGEAEKVIEKIENFKKVHGDFPKEQEEIEGCSYKSCGEWNIRYYIDENNKHVLSYQNTRMVFSACRYTFEEPRWKCFAN